MDWIQFVVPERRKEERRLPSPFQQVTTEEEKTTWTEERRRVEILKKTMGSGQMEWTMDMDNWTTDGRFNGNPRRSRTFFGEGASVASDLVVYVE